MNRSYLYKRKRCIATKGTVETKSLPIEETGYQPDMSDYVAISVYASCMFNF